ncbi:hypothetical protein CALCODRAFT_509007 [Calocera cornea HHB12733]|uniref:Uncharacterized protein n=1 Tax=Calocera cornea HHB12733 TaxID=1353952 RepID=A0A165FTN2_9BASI|nr:hypothetical protein CALCODRAFT_509007 [Calocera cornea HHB12733]
MATALSPIPQLATRTKPAHSHPPTTHRVEGESDLAVITQEWLLQLDLNLDTKAPPPPIPARRHARVSSTPSKLMSTSPPNASEHKQQSQAAARAGSSPPEAQTPTVHLRPPTPAEVAPSPEMQGKKRNGSAVSSLSASSALGTVPEERTLSLPTGRATPDSSDTDWAHVPPRPDSAMSMSAFVPVSTHDYPYMYLLGWPTYYAGDLEEKQWVIGFDEGKWEEERQKAFEWIRLKKLTRRVDVAKGVRALRRKDNRDDAEEEEDSLAA